MVGRVTPVGGPHTDALLKAQVAQATMARLMASAGHDLKQPLHLAVMSIDRALKDSIDAKTAGRLRMATDALRHLGFDLDYLAQSSQNPEALEPRCQPVSLNAIAAEIELDWAFYAETYGVELRIDAPSAILKTDPRMLATI
jgi:signal transduction histidine kinase